MGPELSMLSTSQGMGGHFSLSFAQLAVIFVCFPVIHVGITLKAILCTCDLLKYT